MTLTIVHAQFFAYRCTLKLFRTVSSTILLNALPYLKNDVQLYRFIENKNDLCNYSLILSDNNK